MRFLDTSVYPQSLCTGTAVVFNGIPCAQVLLPPSNIERICTRLILITTLTGADMTSTQYWDGQNVLAPFYLMSGALAMTNLLDATLVGSFNVNEYQTPLRIQAATDLFGLWLGVIPNSVGKCQATFICEAY